MTLVVLCASAQAADAGRLFRYRDAQGVMHISSNLPPGQAQAGYEVLDSRTLKQLEKVEPRLTPQQLAERARQRQRAAVEAEEAARARRADLAKQHATACCCRPTAASRRSCACGTASWAT